MGLYKSGDIFQAKVDEILSDIEGVKTYIYYIIVIFKGSFPQHIYHIIFIFAGLRTTVLKINAPETIFGSK